MRIFFPARYGRRFALTTVAAFCLLGAGSANSEDPAPTRALRQPTITRYHDARSFRAHIHAIASVEHDGKVEIWSLEESEIVMDRSRGMRATTRYIDRGRSKGLVTAWGPLNAVQSYREDTDDGFISHVESRAPDQNAAEFSDFGANPITLNPLQNVLECALRGEFFSPESGPWTKLPAPNGRMLLLSYGDAQRESKRQFELGPDGSILTITGFSKDYRQTTRYAARFDRQEFDVVIPTDDLNFAPPEYAAAYDIRSKLSPDAKRARILELAEHGDRNAKIRLALGSPFDADNATSKISQFAQVLARLTEAEGFGFTPAYAFHAQLIQPDNREWFPAELKKLTDAELRRRQREILFDGAKHCSGEAANALVMDQSRKPSAEDKERLSKFATDCAEKRIPDEIRRLQARSDAGASLEELIR